MDQQANGVSSEMERLRDILYGDFARQSRDRIAELEHQLVIVQKETLDQFNSHNKEQLSKLEDSIRAHFDQVTSELRAEINQLKHRMDHVEAHLISKESLGQFFQDLGARMQNVSFKESD